MKNIILTLIVSVVVLSSCQSEYSERMQKAKLLKANYTRIEKTYKNRENQRLKYFLHDLKTKIKYQAKASGNESLFLKEIWEK